MWIYTVVVAIVAITHASSLLAGLPRGKPLAALPTFTSTNGVMDLDMYAVPGDLTPFKLTTFATSPIGAVYKVCYSQQPDTCTSPYGGVQWSIQQGDSVRIRLYNQLPGNPTAEHALSSPSMAYLAENPTNLHFHGFDVMPNVDNRTLGDYIFAILFNTANGNSSDSTALLATPNVLVYKDWVDYRIDIPSWHHSGLFWFHPHVHGLTQNQITQGLGGVATIGNLADYVSCPPAAGMQSCNLDTMPVRYLTLKTSQFLPTGVLLSDPAPVFCDPQQAVHLNETLPRQGVCVGVGNYVGGVMFFAVNGQVYPNVDISSVQGEIWGVTNIMASETAEIVLFTSTRRRLRFQVVSVDGVNVEVDPSTLGEGPVMVNGHVVNRVACPGGFTSGTDVNTDVSALCVTSVYMLPGTRVEMHVSHADLDLTTESPVVVLSRPEVITGPTGDDWPSVDLMSVNFSLAIAASSSSGGHAMLRGGKPSLLAVAPPSHHLFLTSTHTADTDDGPLIIPTTNTNPEVKWRFGDCGLPTGFQRRVYFGVPIAAAEGGGDDAFGMAVEVINAKGHVVPGSQMNLTAYSPFFPLMCVYHNTVERWILVNVAQEAHNFHIHQTTFTVVQPSDLGNFSFPSQTLNHSTFVDSVVLPFAQDDCGKDQIGGFKAANCKAFPVVVDIPFLILGKFVAHCHIAEHTNGGMMIGLQVVDTGSAGELLKASSRLVVVVMMMVLFMFVM